MGQFLMVQPGILVDSVDLTIETPQATDPRMYPWKN